MSATGPRRCESAGLANRCRARGSRWRGRCTVAVLTVVLVAGCVHTRDHSLVGPPPNGFAMRQPVGHVFTDGQLTVRHVGSQPVTIKNIEPVLTGDGLEFLGAYIAGLERESASVQYYDQFPPADTMLGRLQKAEGAQLAPGPEAADRGYEILLGFRVRSEGRATRQAVKIIYSDGSGERTITTVSTIAVCAPEPGPECEPEHGED